MFEPSIVLHTTTETVQHGAEFGPLGELVLGGIVVGLCILYTMAVLSDDDTMSCPEHGYFTDDCAYCTQCGGPLEEIANPGIWTQFRETMGDSFE